ncbi:UNVERIFIED_CONTAM: hypothetical protein Slati_4216300 [Sesamum latifolium]|uniref:Uncharacterized protein n=1 Tax=Sesamum latifolium TaxID=2727402 RepID=A0AAW2TAR3_9LAMI
MKNYIQELGVAPSIAEPVVIFCDNNGAITQAKEMRSHHHSKHILRRLVQDGNRHPNSCPRPRSGDGRRKDRTRTNSKPKNSHGNSPSLYVPWTVARRPPKVTGSPDQGFIESY